MGKKGSKAAPVATPTPQVQTPDVDVAQVAAQKALDAREGAVTATQASEEEQQKKTAPTLAAAAAPAQPRPRKRPMDPASMAAMSGGMNSSAVITG